MATGAAQTSPASAVAELSAPAAQVSKRRVVLGAVVALAAVGGLALYALQHGRESTDDAQIDADVVAVPTHVGGTVTKLHFQENQRVVAGELLVELEDRPLQVRLAEAEATLARAEAQAEAADAEAALAERTAVGNKTAARATLLGASAGERSSTEQLKEGEAQLASAQATRTQAVQDLGRMRALMQSGAASKAQLDQAETQARLAESSLQSASARLETLRSSISAARSRVDEASARAAQTSDVSSSIKLARAKALAAHAEVDVARAHRDLAALDVSYTKIIAPQAGVVSKKAVQVGQQIATGQAIVQLVTDGRWVTANFKETQVGHMRAGQPAKIEIDAFPGLHLHGELESLSGATGSRFTLLPPDNASGNFTRVVQRVPVRVKIVDLPATVALRPGMNVDLSVDTR